MNVGKAMKNKLSEIKIGYYNILNKLQFYFLQTTRLVYRLNTQNIAQKKIVSTVMMFRNWLAADIEYNSGEALVNL